MNSFESTDMGVFLSDFASPVTPITWGGDPFPAIHDRIEIEVSTGGLATSRYRSVLYTSRVNVPATAIVGDRVEVDGMVFKIIDYQESEPGITLLVLGKV